jgi:exosortase K
MLKIMLARRPSLIDSFRSFNWQRAAQFLVVLLCAAGAKLYYSTASVNQLRWILGPTTFLVELVTGYQFEFESYAGYIKSDRTFVIAASCAGVNFLITAFLMLALRKLWLHRSQTQSAAWRFIPLAGLIAYLATLVANTVRISTALRIGRMPAEAAAWLSPAQLHRFEGIFIYFGFLLLLFVLSERLGSESGPRAEASSLLRRALFPLIIYYATTLGIPLVNGAYRSGSGTGDFWEHSVFVLVIPLLLMIPLATFRWLTARRSVEWHKVQSHNRRSRNAVA